MLQTVQTLHCVHNQTHLIKRAQYSSITCVIFIMLMQITGPLHVTWLIASQQTLSI